MGEGDTEEVHDDYGVFPSVVGGEDVGGPVESEGLFDDIEGGVELGAHVGVVVGTHPFVEGEGIFVGFSVLASCFLGDD